MAARKRDRVTVTDPYSGVELTVNADSPQAKAWGKPVQESPSLPDGEPSGDWTNAQIDAYADASGIDLDGATKKADKLAVIAAAGEGADEDPDDGNE